MFLEVKPCQEFVDARLQLLFFYAIDAAEETYVFPDGEVFVERESLTHVAYVALYLLVLGADVIACHASCAACGLV